MSQRKKAKTKKQLKKAINRLYNALMKEKESHRKASKIVGHLKQSLARSANVLRDLAHSNMEHKQKTCALTHDNNKTLDVSAELIKRLTANND